MASGTAADPIKELHEVQAAFIRSQPGFAGAGFHMNDAQTRIANCAQWRRRDDFMALLWTPEMRERNRMFAGLCSRFEPVVYEVVGV